MGRQKKNLQSKGMEDSPLKDRDKQTIRYRIQNNGYKDAQGTHRQLQGTERELQQYEKGNKNYKQNPG